MPKKRKLSPEVFESGVNRYVALISERISVGIPDSIEEPMFAQLRQDLAAMEVDDYLAEHNITPEESGILAAHAFFRISQLEEQFADFDELGNAA